MNRRTFLSVAAASAIAGCGNSTSAGDGGSDGGDSESGGAGGEGGSDTPASGPERAMRGLDAQPTLGPEPGSATGLIVAFEDPSCPRCRAFERQVVPKIRSNLVETGTATYAFRGYPVIYEWGNPATHALEATYARDEAAVWELAAYYFENQRSLVGNDAESIYAETASFLSDQTDLDGAAVVEAARGEAAASAVQTDLDDGMAAGAGRTTPHVFLFRDGEYQTKAAGSVSYETIETVLQV